MPITAFTVVPSRSKPATFESDADTFFQQISTTFVAEANALESSLQASVLTGTSVTSLVVSAASKSLTTQAGKAWAVGVWLYLINSATPTTYMVGQVTAYNTATGALTVNVTTAVGTGTVATWAIAPATPPGTVTGLSGGTAGVVPYQSATGITGFTAAGSAGQILVSGGTGAPTFTSTPSATTPAQGNSSTLLATTAFVQNALGNLSGSSSVSTTSTLTAAQSGELLLAGAGAVITVTLPTVASVPAGTSYTLFSTTASGFNVAAQGASAIFGIEGGNAASIFVAQNALVTVASDGSNWIATSQTAGPNTAQKAQTGYQRLPSGVIIQWGRNSGGTVADGTAGVINFPITFPSANYNLVGSCAIAYCILGLNLINSTGFGWQVYNRASGNNVDTTFTWLAIGA